MSTKITASLATIALLLLLTPGAAHADTFGTSGYVCDVSYEFSGDDYYGFKGTYGYVMTTMTSAPNCKGTIEYNFACSTGATNPACNNARAQRSEAALLAVFETLMRAKETQLKVWMHHYSWNATSVGNQYSIDNIGYQR